jgi:hypothetical protein
VRILYDGLPWLKNGKGLNFFKKAVVLASFRTPFINEVALELLYYLKIYEIL